MPLTPFFLTCPLGRARGVWPRPGFVSVLSHEVASKGIIMENYLKKWLGAIVQHVCSEPRGGVIKEKTVEDRLGSVFALSHEVA